MFHFGVGHIKDMMSFFAICVVFQAALSVVNVIFRAVTFKENWVPSTLMIMSLLLKRRKKCASSSYLKKVFTASLTWINEDVFGVLG